MKALTQAGAFLARLWTPAFQVFQHNDVGVLSQGKIDHLARGLLDGAAARQI